MQEFKEVSGSTFELDSSPTGHSLPSHFHCDWYHEEWKVPPRYIGGVSVVPSRPRLTLKSKFDYSGTWRARWGNREYTYYVGEFLCDLHMMHLEAVMTLIHCTTALIVDSVVRLHHLHVSNK